MTADALSYPRRPHHGADPVTPAQDVASYRWPALVRGLQCKLLGHRWRVTTPAGISAAPCLECRRCARVGWLV